MLAKRAASTTRPDPKRVLIVGSFAPSLVQVRGELIAEAVNRGHTVMVAAPGIDSGTDIALRALGAEPHELPIDNTGISPLGLIGSLRAMRELIREVRPDVTFAYAIKPVILSAIAGRAESVKRIVSLITGVGYAFTGGLEPRRLVSRFAATALYRLALSRSDVTIFENPDDELFFRRSRMLAPSRPSAVVDGCGIDLQRFPLTPLPEGASFLMIARLLKDKGIREFGAAAKRLKADHPEVPIALVGYLDPSPDSLRQQELDALVACGIDFKGQLDDVRPAIAETSVYVLPSYREGLPRSVLEAMAMGRAIVTTDAPGCRETVRDGENGFLVPPRDADALYAAMLHFVDEPALAARMGAASRRIAEERYDVEAVNADLLSYAGL